MDDDPSYDIAVARQSSRLAGAESAMVSALRAALQRFAVRGAQLSLALVDDDQIAELNQTYLAHAGPTDVITFDLADEPPEDGAAERVVDGEIVVSLETAEREAAVRGNRPESEASLYAVHGLLHLLGYDDASEEDAAAMHALEDEVLTALGLGPAFGRGSES